MINEKPIFFHIPHRRPDGTGDEPNLGGLHFSLRVDGTESEYLKNLDRYTERQLQSIIETMTDRWKMDRAMRVRQFKCGRIDAKRALYAGLLVGVTAALYIPTPSITIMAIVAPVGWAFAAYTAYKIFKPREFDYEDENNHVMRELHGSNEYDEAWERQATQDKKLIEDYRLSKTQ